MYPWMRIATEAWLMAVEAAAVVSLRSMAIVAGDAKAQAETNRMISEKLVAGLAWQVKALTGGLGSSPATQTSNTIQHYRQRIRSNHRRL